MQVPSQCERDKTGAREPEQEERPNRLCRRADGDAWRSMRADGVKLVATAPRPTDATTWRGSSALDGLRWLRDESYPGQLDYHLARVLWRPESTFNSTITNQAESTLSPNVIALVGTPLPPMPLAYAGANHLIESEIGMDVPRDEVIRRLHELHG